MVHCIKIDLREPIQLFLNDWSNTLDGGGFLLGWKGYANWPWQQNCEVVTLKIEKDVEI